LKHYIADRVVLNERVKRTSDKLYYNVDADLNSVISLYNSIINQPDTNTSKLAGFARNNFSTNASFQEIPKELLDYQVPINEIILINSNGIVSQAVTRTAFSNIVQIDLSERLYFKNVIDPGKSWTLKNSTIKGSYISCPGKEQEKFYIESIKSYNTGYHETAISFHLRDADSIGSSTPVLAITSHIPSLYDQILPKDIEFVVINEEGDVLFHSVESKNLHENFLDEANSNPRLMGALHHRVDKTLEITYNEKQWLARVIPLEDMPLYHITLLDLQQTQNKNARIFLFTFCFLLITFLCILVGIQIMQRINKGNTFIADKSGTLTWLFFQQAKYPGYKALLQIQSIIIICQLAGMFFNSNPIIILLYQLIFIGFSGFAALAILGERKDPFRNFFRKSHLSTSLIMIIDIFLITLLWSLDSGFIIYFSIIILGTLSGYIHYFSKKELSNQSLPNDTGESITTLAKKVFLSYMFLWLISFSAVPVIQYYFSIKKQEEKLWQRDQMEQVAHKNLLLKKELEEAYSGIKKGSWYPRIQGNGIDYLKITERSCINDYPIQKKDTSEASLSPGDRIYSRLPDPVTKGDHLMSLLENESFQDEWNINDSVLCYSRTESEGEIRVASSDREKIRPLIWLLYFSIPILLILLFIWSLNSYMVKHLFNTLLANWVTPEIPPWDEVIKNEKINKVLLISFGGKSYFEKSNPNPKLIQAEQLFSPDFDIKTFKSKEDEIIWIHGLGDYFEQIDKAELILDNLMKINLNTKGKLIIELPYDLDFLYEYYEDYMNGNELDKKDHLRIFSFKRSLGNLFKDYYKYLGKFIPETLDSSSDDKKPPAMSNGDFQKDPAEYKLYSELINDGSKKQQWSQKQLLGIKDGMELHYSYIWNKLTKMEKMILYDLVDDGMLNFKNKALINQLEMKGLIKIKPFPKLFAESFQYFLLFSIDPEEKHAIEQTLNRQGKWRNKRYIILLIVVLLAGFVFIAQGSSIEKVIGVLTGSLAVFSGITRLIDSNAFRQT
ncbi:MAG: cache domain-containing protein, partial [Bacteroidales bacterium]|nr:cache domain-containing protein [Bacteroidales bacterium]